MKNANRASSRLQIGNHATGALGYEPALSVWLCVILSGLMGVGVLTAADREPPLIFINTSFENACPLYWETDDAGVIHISLVYDQERGSPNRANGHWFFELQAKPDAPLTIVLHNLENIYNGRKSSPGKDGCLSFVSEDGKVWRPVRAETTADHGFKFTLVTHTGSLYLARLQPYRLSDLQDLLKRIRLSPLVEITKIGETVEGRDLEIVRVGNADAPHCVLLRGRAHPWEAGGSWAIQGLIDRLLRADADAARYLKRYCVYIMPMANKDGVVRGRTRFNQLGADLNRKWDKPADPVVAPENAALEGWLTTMVGQGKAPNLVIDLHNDSSGQLHVTRLDIGLEKYLKRMDVFEAMLRKHTWFTEGSTRSGYRTGTIEEGLVERFRIDACVLELNDTWIAGLDDTPSAEHWELFGAQLAEALYHYFAATGQSENP